MAAPKEKDGKHALADILRSHRHHAHADVELSGDDLDTSAKLNDEGRVNISLARKHTKLQKLILSHFQTQDPEASPNDFIPPSLAGYDGSVPPLNVVIQIVGSRGDVQPFIAIGKVLKEKHGHRVRLATHAIFKTFVEENGLEFFNIGGDPSGLMSYSETAPTLVNVHQAHLNVLVVKNPGLLPSKTSLKAGDVGARKKDIEHILAGCWRSCIETGDGMDEPQDSSEAKGPALPFIADAIIANPPGFAHVHCAEKLGIPFHIMFTMPWTPTQAFPHPLANIEANDADQHLANFLSYPLVAILTWQGLGGVINKFREDTLHLEPASVMWTPILSSNNKAPFTYCFSPALIPKPRDWGNNIRVAGFYFLDLASNYTPEPALAEFLAAGPPPVYIGFGSIVVDDPNAMTALIFEAVQKAGVRALVSKGWGGIGGDDLKVPENIMLLGNCPHDWLFKHVSAVVHHGGAGTTATGIAAGKPTLVVPFFGDQPFWGSMVARAGAGPEPINNKKLTADNLAAAIQFCQKPEVQAAAKVMAESIAKERGAENGAQSFQDFLPVTRMRCEVDPRRSAVFMTKKKKLRLSAFATAVLCLEGELSLEDLKINRAAEYDLSEQPWDPVSGGASAILGTMANLMVGTSNLPSEIAKAVRAKSVANGPPAGLQHRDSTQSIADAQASSLADVVVKPFHGTPGARDHYRSATVKAIGHDFKNIVAFPREFIQALGKGFHNAPKLYHDRTVRTPDKVTGLKSGLKGAGKELTLQTYDAFTGVITQPIDGAKREGAKGFVKGVGKGVGGLLLKPEAAILGAVGYTMEGWYKQLHRHSTTIEHQVAAARIAEGLAAYEHSTDEEKKEILDAWHALLEQNPKLSLERTSTWRLHNKCDAALSHTSTRAQSLPDVSSTLKAGSGRSSLSSDVRHSEDLVGTKVDAFGEPEKRVDEVELPVRAAVVPAADGDTKTPISSVAALPTNIDDEKA